MTTSHDRTNGTPGKLGQHGWSMIACGALGLVIAIVLVATDVVSSGLLVPVVACAVMLAMMARGVGRP